MTLLHFGVKYLRKQKSINKKEDISIDKLSRFLKSFLASREDPTRACHEAGWTSWLNCTPKLHNIHHNKISNSKSKKETTFCLFYIRKTLVRAVTARFTTEYILGLCNDIQVHAQVRHREPFWKDLGFSKIFFTSILARFVFSFSGYSF